MDVQGLSTVEAVYRDYHEVQGRECHSKREVAQGRTRTIHNRKKRRDYKSVQGRGQPL